MYDENNKFNYAFRIASNKEASVKGFFADKIFSLSSEPMIIVGMTGN